MVNCNLVSTSIGPNIKLVCESYCYVIEDVKDKLPYDKETVDSIIYLLQLTRPDIVYVVNVLSWVAVK